MSNFITTPRILPLTFLIGNFAAYPTPSRQAHSYNLKISSSWPQIGRLLHRLLGLPCRYLTSFLAFCSLMARHSLCSSQAPIRVRQRQSRRSAIATRNLGQRRRTARAAPFNWLIPLKTIGEWATGWRAFRRRRLAPARPTLCERTCLPFRLFGSTKFKP